MSKRLATACEHVDRLRYAKDKCRSCYQKDYYKAWKGKTPAICHPDRLVHAKGLCHPCYEMKLSNQPWRRRKKMYGVGEEEYRAAMLSQGERCAICREKDTAGRSLAVDHDHVTDKFRALLCGNCNRGLGLFQDSADLLRVASEYIEKHRR